MVSKTILLGIIFQTFIIRTAAEADDSLYSRSIANFMKIQNELRAMHQKDLDRSSDNAGQDRLPENQGSDSLARRADVLNPLHEGWSGHLLHHVKTQQIPDFGHHEIHTMDEHGEKFHLDSSPRHHVHHGHHHMPHYHHEVHTFHHDGEHPHTNHEHFVHHEPIYHHIPVTHHGGHHVDHHDEDEESGDHEEHHDEGNMHGDTEDWDVGGGYFQLEEHGSDVNVVALKKHGTKVHMGGGDFNVIRDPWRHHSLFAGLFHPHEMPGHGHLPMEQFHQHFTYIANDRAINHHVYEHHTHNEDNHIHERDPGHEHDYFYNHHPEPNNHGDKRVFNMNPSVNVTAKAQVKQKITGSKANEEELISIPLSFARNSDNAPNVQDSPYIVPEEAENVKKYLSYPVRDSNWLPGAVESRSREWKVVKEKKELPKGKSPRLSPFNGNHFGPSSLGNRFEAPFAPIFKRQLSSEYLPREDRGISIKSSIRRPLSKIPSIRVARLKRAFLGKLLSNKS
ncbi:uncharacterized protein LOC135689737 [Rhopilema esculentum]|uniref:uncharacterized protein LOC135689737 n=1 Tax=Rhopilema esculentum TaxID=499914 RepID=UPI0031DAACDB